MTSVNGPHKPVTITNGERYPMTTSALHTHLVY